MVIEHTIRMDNSEHLQRFIDLSERSENEGDTLSELSRLHSELITIDQAKQRVLFTTLKKASPPSPRLKILDKLEDLNKRFHAILTDLIESRRDDYEWEDKMASTINFLRLKQKKEEAVLNLASDILDHDTRAQLVTRYERFRASNPEASSFQIPNPPYSPTPRTG